MALCNFGQFYFVSKVSQKPLELEPWNLMNGLVVMSEQPDKLLKKFWKKLLELWPFVILGIFTLSAKYLQKLLELEPWNLINGFIMISRQPD